METTGYKRIPPQRSESRFDVLLTTAVDGAVLLVPGEPPWDDPDVKVSSIRRALMHWQKTRKVTLETKLWWGSDPKNPYRGDIQPRRTDPMPEPNGLWVQVVEMELDGG